MILTLVWRLSLGSQRKQTGKRESLWSFKQEMMMSQSIKVVMVGLRMLKDPSKIHFLLRSRPRFSLTSYNVDAEEEASMRWTLTLEEWQ